MQEHAFALQPAGGEHPHPADFHAAILDGGRGFVHAQLAIVQIAFPDFPGHLRRRFPVRRIAGCQIAGRALQEQGKIPAPQGLYPNARQAVGGDAGRSIGVQKRFKIHRLIGKEGGHNTLADCQRPPRPLLQRIPEQGKQFLQFPEGHACSFSRNAHFRLGAEAFPQIRHSVPAGKGIGFFPVRLCHGPQEDGGFAQQGNALLRRFILDRVQQETRKPFQFQRFRHAAAKQAGQAVHGVVPARLAAVHFNAQAFAVQQGEFIHRQGEHFFKQRGKNGFPRPVFHPIGALGIKAGPRKLFFACAHGPVLPHFAVLQRVGFPAGAHRRRAVVVSVHRTAKQQFFPVFGPNGQIILHQIQVIIPMIAPIALAKARFKALIAKGYQGQHEALRVALQGQMLLKQGIGDLPRGKGPGNQLFDALRASIQIRMQHSVRFLFLFRRQKKGAGPDFQGIIAVDLDEAVEIHDVVIPDFGVYGAIHAPVLAHIPVIAVALGKIFPGDGKEIVVPFGVAMLAAEQMQHALSFSLPDHEGIAAPEEIIHIALLNVGVQRFVGGDGFHIRRERVRRFPGLPKLSFRIARGPEGRCFFI